MLRSKRMQTKLIILPIILIFFLYLYLDDSSAVMLLSFLPRIHSIHYLSIPSGLSSVPIGLWGEWRFRGLFVSRKISVFITRTGLSGCWDIFPREIFPEKYFQVTEADFLSTFNCEESPTQMLWVLSVVFWLWLYWRPIIKLQGRTKKRPL